MATDALLSTGARLTALAAGLAAALPAGTAVYADTPDPTGSTPFVVLAGTLTPLRNALDGHWSMAELVLAAHSVHDTAAQARALGDLVRTWVLTQMATPGQQDVAPDTTWHPDDPGGVHQGHEAWLITLVRS